RTPGVEVLELVADHPQREEGVTLLGQREPQALDVGLAVHPVARPAAAGADQSLLLEEAQLGDAHRRELRLQHRQDRPDAHRRLGGGPWRPRPTFLLLRFLLLRTARAACRRAHEAEASPRFGLGW